MAVLVSLIALPTFAATTIDTKHANWTGAKGEYWTWGRYTDKLACGIKYRGAPYGSREVTTLTAWQTSMDDGNSPVCPVSLWDSGARWWHVSDEGYDAWNAWKKTKDYSDYQFVKDQMKVVKDSELQRFMLIAPDGRVVEVDKNALLKYLNHVKIGIPEYYESFINNNRQGYVDTSWMWPEYKEQFLRGLEKITYVAQVRYQHLPTPFP